MEGEGEEGLFVGETAKRSVHNYHSHYERHPFSSKLMHRLYWFGRGLTWGAVHSIEAMFKVFVMPFRPGCYGQAKGRIGECARRVGLFILAIIMFPFTAALFPIGCMCRALATRSKRDFLFVRPPPALKKGRTPPTSKKSKRDENGKGKAKKSKTKKKKKGKGKEKVQDGEGEHRDRGPKSIQIWTQNVGFLPFVSSFNNLSSPMQRVPLLLEEIRSCTDDVICLQEQFHVGVDAYLIRHLGCGEGSWPGFRRSDGGEEDDLLLGELEEGLLHEPHQQKPPFRWLVSDCGPSSRRLNSGLTILSRYPLENPEFTEFTNGSGDDRWAAKGVLGCTVLLGLNPLDEEGVIKMTIFNTHLNAGSNVTQHKQQMQTAVDFMNYYNKKYLRNPHDLIIASVLVGDFNFSPLKYFNTGKLAEDPEWATNMDTWEANSIVDLFYEEAQAGELRKENIETWLAFQELFFSELQSAGRKGEGEEGEDIPMNSDALLKGLKKLLVREALSDGGDREKEAQRDEEEGGEGVRAKPSFDWVAEAETFIKQEVTRQLQVRFGESFNAVSFRTSRIQSMTEHLQKLHLIPQHQLVDQREDEEEEGGESSATTSKEVKGERKGRYERLLPGTSINTKVLPRGRFPSKIDHDDLDHILVQKKMRTNGGEVVEGIIEDATFMVVQASRAFSDHLGKRANLKIAWGKQ